MQIEGRRFFMLHNLYLTRGETKALKKWVFIFRDVLVVAIAVVSIISLWIRGDSWPLVPIFFVFTFVAYRIYRRSLRRCPHCSDLTETKGDHEVKKKRRRLSRAIFGGWFVHQNYWQEAMPIKFDSSPDVDAKIRAVLRGVYHQDPDSQYLCHFHYTCRVCDFDFSVKPPLPHSFERRPLFFRHW